MTQPAEITSAADWNQLIANIRLVVDDADALYERITEGTDDADHHEEEPMPDPDYYPDLVDDPDQQAFDEQERERRLEAEIDGEPDGDYEPEPADDGDPAMGA